MMRRHKWIEFIVEETRLGGTTYYHGNREELPIFLANALIAQARVKDAIGPYPRLPESEPLDDIVRNPGGTGPVEQESEDLAEPTEDIPEATEESEGTEATAEEEEVKEDTEEVPEPSESPISMSEFKELSAADQKAKLKSLGIATSKLTNEAKRSAAFSNL